MHGFSQGDIISIRDFSKDDIKYILEPQRKWSPLLGPWKSLIFCMENFWACCSTSLHPYQIILQSCNETSGRMHHWFSEARTSSATKGEKLSDTVRTVGEYTDALVLRHNMEGTARLAADIVDVPVINAGDGAGQHPTQTLLDLYTMKRLLGKIRNLHVALVGDLKYGRTVHSLAYALAMFGTRMSFVSPPELKMPREIMEDLSGAGVSVHETSAIRDVLPYVDVLYVTRIQKERFPDPQEYLKIKGAYTIDKDLLKNSETIVMHPLPRLDEIATDVDSTPYGKYFQQAFYGVPVRMALLKSLIK